MHAVHRWPLLLATIVLLALRPIVDLLREGRGCRWIDTVVVRLILVVITAKVQEEPAIRIHDDRLVGGCDATTLDVELMKVRCRK